MRVGFALKFCTKKVDSVANESRTLAECLRKLLQFFHTYKKKFLKAKVLNCRDRNKFHVMLKLSSRNRTDFTCLEATTVFIDSYSCGFDESQVEFASTVPSCNTPDRWTAACFALIALKESLLRATFLKKMPAHLFRQKISRERPGIDDKVSKSFFDALIALSLFIRLAQDGTVSTFRATSDFILFLFKSFNLIL